MLFVFSDFEYNFYTLSSVIRIANVISRRKPLVDFLWVDFLWAEGKN